MRTLEWRFAAQRDLLAIVEYIADDNPNAAQQLKDDIESKAAQLPHHPELYRAGRVANTREMVVRTNYVLIYTIGKDRVSVLRVLHAAQQWPNL
ncbi:MAG: type II toxin-antitoxin system RelE/ParE family toxin [Halothiobacillaceae bacterium]